MGWLFGWSSRKELVQHLIQPWETETQSTKCLAKAFSGNDMWCVFERTFKGERRAGELLTPENRAERFIVLFKIAGGNHCTEGRGDGWGYKDMDETSGPYTYSCPLKFLDMVPEPKRTPSPYCHRCGHSKHDHEHETGPCNVRDSKQHCICYQFEQFNWRAEVRKYWAARNQPLAVGQIVRLTNGRDYRLLEVGKCIRGVEVKIKLATGNVEGDTYRIPRSMLILRKESNEENQTKQESTAVAESAS